MSIQSINSVINELALNCSFLVLQVLFLYCFIFKIWFLSKPVIQIIIKTLTIIFFSDPWRQWSEHCTRLKMLEMISTTLQRAYLWTYNRWLPCRCLSDLEEATAYPWNWPRGCHRKARSSKNGGIPPEAVLTFPWILWTICTVKVPHALSSETKQVAFVGIKS